MCSTLGVVSRGGVVGSLLTLFLFWKLIYDKLINVAYFKRNSYNGLYFLSICHISVHNFNIYPLSLYYIIKFMGIKVKTGMSHKIFININILYRDIILSTFLLLTGIVLP